MSEGREPAFQIVSVSRNADVCRGMVGGPIEKIEFHDGRMYEIRPFFRLEGTDRLKCVGRVQIEPWEIRWGATADIAGLAFV